MRLVVSYAAAGVVALAVAIVSVSSHDALAAAFGGVMLGVSVTGLVVLSRIKG